MTGSRVFAGRERELSGLRSALCRGSRLLLVVADAGVGKTQFVTEGLRQPPAGRRLAAWGACLPLAERLPLLAMAEVLDALSRQDGGALLDGALGVIPQYARAEVSRLLPQLQPAGADTGGWAGAWQRQRMFSGMADLLAAIARQGGLVIVIEDVHWADSQTLDFLTFMVRAGRGEAITVVATCRGGELLREPHVSRWLAHMRGGREVEEIRLAPLTREEVAEQVTGLMGGPPSAELAEELYARGEGNPFFTEQLVASAQARAAGSAGLPSRLAELLVARVAVCGADAGAALAALAVAGRPLTEDQLCEVTGLRAETLRAGLRELAEAGLLAEAAPDGLYRACHALLAEAVATGLLAGDRLVLHERTARVLQASAGEALAAEAADHWAAAGHAAEELRARVTAAAAAQRVFGYAEAAVHWQRAIELSQAGSSAGTGNANGIDLPAMYVRAIDALHVSGDGERAGVLAEEAYRRFAGHPDPATAAVIHERAGRFRGLGATFFGGQDASGSGQPLIAEALRLFEQAPPSAEYAEALFYYGHYLFSGQGRHRDGITAINRGLEVAEAARATSLIPRFQPLRAFYQFVQGQMEEGFATLHQGQALARSAGDGEAVLLTDMYESDALLKTARLREAAEVAVRGLHAAREAGLDTFWNSSILAANAAEALLGQGRTAEAAAFIGPLTGGPPDGDHWLAHLFRAEADLLRGDMQAAEERQRQIADLAGGVGNFDWSREMAQRAAELALWAGRPDQALAEIRRAIAVFKSRDQAIFCGHLLTTGMRACADLAERARARRDEPAARAAGDAGGELASFSGRLSDAPFTDHPFVASIPAERATWDAERARLAAAGDLAAPRSAAQAWTEAARAWADLRWPHRAGYAWWRQAEAQLNSGQPGDAATALQAAASASEGHAPLLAEVRKLARRARISLPPAATGAIGLGPSGLDAAAHAPDGPDPAAKYGLTDRELSVLRLLGAGRTNSQIGAELFMSPKTASVHVTSILRKLGVTGRVQAAAAAERAGLLDDNQP